MRPTLAVNVLSSSSSAACPAIRALSEAISASWAASAAGGASRARGDARPWRSPAGRRPRPRLGDCASFEALFGNYEPLRPVFGGRASASPAVGNPAAVLPIRDPSGPDGLLGNGACSGRLPGILQPRGRHREIVRRFWPMGTLAPRSRPSRNSTGVSPQSVSVPSVRWMRTRPFDGFARPRIAFDLEIASADSARSAPSGRQAQL